MICNWELFSYFSLSSSRVLAGSGLIAIKERPTISRSESILETVAFLLNYLQILNDCRNLVSGPVAAK
jgi:hypothetical protein